MTISWFSILPGWAVAAIATVGVLLLAHGCFVLVRKRVSGRWISFLALSRAIAVVLFILCLLRPVVTYREEALQRPDVLVLIDTSLSMAETASGDATSRLTRLLGSMRESGLTDRLEELFETCWFSFDVDARPVQKCDVDSLRPTGTTTHIGKSLSSAWQYYRRTVGKESASGAQPVKILLLSDGNDLGDEDAAGIARELGAPVYAVAAPDVAAAEPDPRPVIVGFQASRRVLLGSECRFRAVLRRDGTPEMAVRLELLEDDQSIASQEFTFAEGQSERVATLVHRPARPGTRQYTLVATPLGVSAAPQTRPHEVSVNVLGRSNSVLMLEDNWRWEFRFLRRLMEDDPSFSFTWFQSRGPSAYMQFVEPESTAKLAGFPRSRAELQWFDIILLGDVNPQSWPPSLVAALRRVIVEDGKSLILVAGPSTVELMRTPDLEFLLPVELSRQTWMPIKGPVSVRATPEGQSSSLFYTAGADTINWRELPPMDQIYPVLRKKPAATILVDAPEHSNAYGNLIVVAEHSIGRGRALFVSTDTLWKWQMLPETDELGSTPYRTFWQQALRSFAPLRVGGTGINIWVQTDRSRYISGQPVMVRVEVDGLDGEYEVEARVTLPDARVIPLQLLRNADQPLGYHCEFEARIPGHVKIAATLLIDGEKVTDSWTVVDVSERVTESVTAPTDMAMLQRIVSVTGGRVIDPLRPDTWPGRDEAAQFTAQQERTVDLWNRLYLLYALIGLLGTDWFLRMLHGIA